MQSLDPELQVTLQPLLPLLPSDKATTLENYLNEAKRAEIAQIPYAFLLEISRWVQANSEMVTLQPEKYTMISLLAGSVTSPRSYFPPPESSVRRGRETISQSTKEVTTLLNCAVTIVGAGFAAWFASSKAGWRNEWVCIFILHLCPHLDRYL
jgi:hypothetical protein